MAQAQLPAFIRKLAGIDAVDVEISRLKLLQVQSPELTQFNNVKEGEFWHSGFGGSVGSTVHICPVYIDKRFILWRPREAGGGILARADDGKHWMPANAEFTIKLKSGHEVTWQTGSTVAASGLTRRGSYDPSDPNSPPAATPMYSIVCSFPDRRDLPPAVLTLQQRAFNVATKLIGNLKVLKAPSFGVVVEMASVKRKSPSGAFYSHVFEIFGPADRPFYEENFAQYRYFMEHGLKVKDLESAQEEAAIAA